MNLEREANIHVARVSWSILNPCKEKETKNNTLYVGSMRVVSAHVVTHAPCQETEHNYDFDCVYDPNCDFYSSRPAALA